ncbi:MAG: hypothetical protein Q4C49_13855 [Bacillota bacterium]|nr:hypothetical protein [Bacillota bacterium]
MTLEVIIDNVIKKVWIEDIAADYDSHRLLKEDCLKNCFYYHLRKRLGDDFLKENRLQIFTEFNEGPLHGTGKRADIAIVKLMPESEDGYHGHLRNYIEDVVAIIELKHKNGESAMEEIYRDFQKLKDYIQKDKIECQYYEGVIHEVLWKEKAWLDRRSTNNWAKGKVTELVASYNEDYEIEFDIFSYNELNLEIDK